MLYQQILPISSTVEDIMDDVAHMPYNCPKSAFNFEGWQEAPQCRLPSLLPYLPPQAAPAPSTNSSLAAVIHSVLLQFQLQRRKGKPLNQVSAPLQATLNSRPCKFNYNSCSKRRTPPLYKSKNLRTSRQLTQGCSNELPPICRILPTSPLHTRHNYPAALAIRWIILPRY